MSNPDKFRSRLFVAVLYPEDDTHVECISKLEKNGYNFAGILHDKDLNEDGEVKKAHWHVIIRVRNAVWNTAVAKELGIAPNYLESCKDQDAYLLYLVHYGKEDKAQYEYESVFGPMRLKLATLLADTDEGTRVLNLIDIVESTPGPIGYTEFLKKAVAAGLYADLRRMGHFATAIVREHNDECYRELQYKADNDAARIRFDHFTVFSDDVEWPTRCHALERQGMPAAPMEVHNEN